MTRDRLYLDAMNTVLSSTGKVVVDVDESDPLLYLPLDQLTDKLQRRNAAGSSGTSSSAGAAGASSSGNYSTNYDSARERGRR